MDPLTGSVALAAAGIVLLGLVLGAVVYAYRLGREHGQAGAELADAREELEDLRAGVARSRRAGAEVEASLAALASAPDSELVGRLFGADADTGAAAPGADPPGGASASADGAGAET